NNKNYCHLLMAAQACPVRPDGEQRRPGPVWWLGGVDRWLGWAAWLAGPHLADLYTCGFRFPWKPTCLD
ncbi:hypothetical protein, partial [Achromobacter insuavis]|uniref:hypothetical protein n=1 Tax=Achromobacter insuavis TaxID=1287735 RepID=UPI001F131483